MSKLLGPREFFEAHELEWTMDGQCSGECCRLITLNYPPESIAALAARESYAIKMGHKPFPSDAGFVIDNFVFVRISSRDGVTGFRRRGHKAAQYRCKQWDGFSKRCMIYDERPNLCRSYGVERRQLCLRRDCSLRPFAQWHAIARWEDDGGPCFSQEAT